MPSSLRIKFRDSQQQAGSSEFPATDVDATNFNAMLGLANTLRLAIIGVTHGGVVEQRFLTQILEVTTDPPQDSETQRGKKWDVFMLGGTTGNPYHRTIPNAEFTLSADGKTLNLAAGAGLALKQSIENFVEIEGESVIVQSVTVRTVDD